MAQGMLITGTERRRRWSDADRARILTEAFALGAVASEVARRHDISTGLLYTWRKRALERLSPASVWEPRFLPAVLGAPEGSATPPLMHSSTTPASPVIEVVLKKGVRVRIEAGMPDAAIAATLKALL
jgi:transposase